MEKNKELPTITFRTATIEEIKPEYLKGLKFTYVKEMSQVLDLALTKQKVKNAKILS